MSQETFVILINIIIDHSFLTSCLTENRTSEPCKDFFENRLIENQSFPIHHTLHITFGKQFTTFENDSISPSIKHINPKLFVQGLTRKDKHMKLLILLSEFSTNLHSNGSRSTKSKVKQHKVRHLHFHKIPEILLILSCTDNRSLRNLISKNLLSTFQFKFYVFNNNDFKVIHKKIR